MAYKNTITPPGQVEEKEELREIARKMIRASIKERDMTTGQAARELASLLPQGHATREIIMDVAAEMQAENKEKQA